MNVLFFERADGGISQAILRDGSAADTVYSKWVQTASPEWLPLVRMWVVTDPVLPPRRFRAAWGAEGEEVKVRLPVARGIRRRELMGEWVTKDGETYWVPGKRDPLLHKTRTKLAKAEKDGKTADIKKYKDRETILLALDEEIDAQLAAITDPAVLDTWEPAEFTETP